MNLENGTDGGDHDGEGEEGDHKAPADSSSSNHELYSGSQDSQSCGSADSGANGCSSGQARSTSTQVNPLQMTAEKIVDQIVSDPDRASQAINRLMRTQKEAIAVMEKVISSQKDALKLVSHLIDYPGGFLYIFITRVAFSANPQPS